MRDCNLQSGYFINFDKFPDLDGEIIDLVLALEDRRFYCHPGVDCLSLIRATLWRSIGKNKGGASTIDMQMVRTLTNDREITYIRKIREIIRAILLNTSYKKKDIINSYLNIAYLGHEVFGVEKASRALFGISVYECSNAQKALLAATLLYPIPNFRSLEWWSKLHWRAMLAKKVISKGLLIKTRVPVPLPMSPLPSVYGDS